MAAINSAHLSILKPADFELGKCGQPIPPDALYLDIPRSFVFSYALAAGAIADVKQALDDKAAFILKSIQVPDDDDYFVRFQFPNGRYHSNAPVHISVYGGLSGRRLLIDPVVECPEASFIGVSLDNSAGLSAVGVVMVFEGVKRIYLK